MENLENYGGALLRAAAGAFFSKKTLFEHFLLFFRQIWLKFDQNLAWLAENNFLPKKCSNPCLGLPITLLYKCFLLMRSMRWRFF